MTAPETIRKVGDGITRLVVEKNEAYGDSYARCAEILRILYPDGISPSQYEDVLGITRLIDKMFRIANRKDAFGENPWRDVAGYGLIASAAAEERSGGG